MQVFIFMRTHILASELNRREERSYKKVRKI